MKLYIKYLTIGLMATTMLASCADILDKKPLTEISDNDLWSDPALLKAFVNSRYNQVGVNGAESMQSSIVDETELTWLRGCETHNFARVSPTDLGRMNGAWWGWDNRSWSTKWTNISNCNIFFERVDNVGFTDEKEKTKLVGQVRFIRAFEYWDLIARWGAMPIITKSFSINDREEIVAQKRNTYKECIDFLVGELDQAAKELPANWNGDDYGRATSDDLANYIPARLTAWLMLAVSGNLNKTDFVKRFGPAHASPNSGYPESALAAILNCRFGGTHDYFGKPVEKPYIGINERTFTTEDMLIAIKTNSNAELLMGLIVCLISIIIH